MVCLKADRRASSTRAVVDLLCLDTLVVEPSVASSQQSVERGTWFNLGPEWTSGGSSSAGIWRHVVCSRIVDDVWTVCRFGRCEGSSIDGGHVSRTASGRRIAWSACVERRLVWDRRLAVKDDWASSDFLLSRLVEFSFCCDIINLY